MKIIFNDDSPSLCHGAATRLRFTLAWQPAFTLLRRGQGEEVS